MKNRVVTFGEIMMRLNPEGYLRLLQSDRFEVSYAGGEAHVAVALSALGVEAAFGRVFCGKGCFTTRLQGHLRP